MVHNCPAACGPAQCERAHHLVPLVGKGTADDPKRPVTHDARGIIAFDYQPSAGGNAAIVEFVARNRAAFAPLLAPAVHSLRRRLMAKVWSSIGRRDRSPAKGCVPSQP